MKTLRRLFLLAALLCPITAAGYAQTYWDGTKTRDWTGTGTEADPIVITTAPQLAGFAEYVNEGNTCKGKYIQLGADIYLVDPSADSATKRERDWVPIGKTWFADNAWGEHPHYEYFKGNFDGKNHTVYNLYYGTTPESPYWGNWDNPDIPDEVLDFTVSFPDLG